MDKSWACPFPEQFAFSPCRDGTGLFTNGDLELISMEFHEIKRIC